MIDYAERIGRARERMEELGVDALYLSPGANAAYLTGWGRRPPTFGNINRNGGWVEGVVLGRTQGPYFAVPRMIKDFWLIETPGMELRVLPDLADPVAFVRDLLGEINPRVVAIENRAWAELTLGIQQACPDVRLRLASDVLAELRIIKSEEELDIMRRAGAIVEEVMAETVAALRPGSGQTEVDVALLIDRLLVERGATGPSFTTAVWQMGPGEQRSMAEKTKQRTLEYGNALCFDFGSVLEEYCYDFGRAVFLGEPPAEFVRAYELVMESARVGAAALQAGKHTAEEVNALARQVIADGGYDHAFTHRLGHGIGLDVHEPAYLDRGDQTLLREGMCFTVEPSIFLPGVFGARTEDIWVVGPTGGSALTNYRRELHVIT